LSTHQIVLNTEYINKRLIRVSSIFTGHCLSDFISSSLQNWYYFHDNGKHHRTDAQQAWSIFNSHGPQKRSDCSESCKIQT